jgi:SAM-dependent methyltransferase
MPAKQILTADIVRNAYQLFLGREPESERAVEDALAHGSVEELRAAFLNSKEFLEKFKPPAVARGPLDAPENPIEWSIDKSDFDDLFNHVKGTWTRLGVEQPHWSVLSAERFKPENIDDTTETAFFESGKGDVKTLLSILTRHDYEPSRLSRAFEFGCGLGRVTPHLAKSFDVVTACDISTTHLDVARQVVADSGAKNVTFELSDSIEFGMRAPFDLWFSKIVLQHNSPPIIAMILRRAFSLLSQGGVAVFQVPTYAVGYKFLIADYLKSMNKSDGIEMHVLPQHAIFKIGKENNCFPVEVTEDGAAGNPAVWRSNMFVMRKE